MAKHIVNNRDDIREAFPGAGARSQYIAVSVAHQFDSLSLVLMQAQRQSRGMLVVFATPEDTLAGWMQGSLCHQFIDSLARLKQRIELDQWLRPEDPSLKKLLLYVVMNAGVTNLDEAFNILLFRLISCEARWEGARAVFDRNRVSPVYKLLDAKLV